MTGRSGIGCQVYAGGQLLADGCNPGIGQDAAPPPLTYGWEGPANNSPSFQMRGGFVERRNLHLRPRPTYPAQQGGIGTSAPTHTAQTSGGPVPAARSWLKLTAITAGTTSGASLGDRAGTATDTLIPGAPYTFSVYVMSSRTGWGQAQLGVQWYGDQGQLVATTTTPQPQLTFPNRWERWSVTLYAPPGAVGARFYTGWGPLAGPPLQVGDYIGIAGMMVEASTQLRDFFDGDTTAEMAPDYTTFMAALLSGLTVTWGRSTTVDQPDPATCTFEAVFLASRAWEYLPYLEVGTLIDVAADGLIWYDATVPTFTDGGFETEAATWWAGEGSNVVRQSVAHSGTAGLAMYPDAATGPGVPLYLAPLPFGTYPNDPGQWDQVPVASPGQEWSWSVWIMAPAGSQVSVRPWLYSNPWAPEPGQPDPGTPAGLPTLVTGTGAWQRIAGTVLIELAGAGSWVGLQIQPWADGARGPRIWDLDPELRTWDLEPALTTWGAGTVFVDDAQILLPGGATARDVAVFEGRITDARVTYYGEYGPTGLPAGHLEVTAADFTADLDARRVGDEPWMAETLQARVQRILALAGSTVNLDVAPRPAATILQWQDVDSQAATGLLKDAAQSADAVLWASAHRITGEYLRIEDPQERTSGLELAWDPHGLSAGQVIIQDTGSGGQLELDSCKPRRDPVTFTRDVSDIVTRASVIWQELTPDPESGLNATTEHTVTLVDEAMEALYGTRGLSVSTQLASQADAYATAQAILARTGGIHWRIEGLELSDALPGVFDGGPADVRLLLELLDGASRGGLPLYLTGLPNWAPMGPNLSAFLEGGTYRYADGAWELAPTVSSALGQGQSARIWDLPPAWRIWDLDPAIRTSDLRGVSVTTASPVLEESAHG